MAYTDPKPMSQSRIVSIIVVIAIHALLLWWMFTGGYQVLKKTAEDLTILDVKEPPPPPEKLPPPPPPKNLPPPPETPVVKTIVNVTPPIQTYSPPPPTPAPPVYTPEPPRPAPPPPPPPPAAPPVALSPRGDPTSWFSPDDIPDSIKRERTGNIGTTGFTVQVGSNGRVTSCSVTQSSGESRLDDLTCRLATSRARFKPGTDSSGQPTGGVYSRRVLWRVQTE